MHSVEKQSINNRATVFVMPRKAERRARPLLVSLSLAMSTLSFQPALGAIITPLSLTSTLSSNWCRPGGFCLHEQISLEVGGWRREGEEREQGREGDYCLPVENWRGEG